MTSSKHGYSRFEIWLTTNSELAKVSFREAANGAGRRTGDLEATTSRTRMRIARQVPDEREPLAVFS